MKNVLVAYFSASGVTEKVAKELAHAEDADLFEIKPVVPYTAEDLDWRNKNSRSTVEMSDLGSRPEVAYKIGDMSKYDIVFVGFPVWWGREPSIVDTFLTTYDFSGKKIIPFCTSGGNDTLKAAERIRTLTGPGASVDDGKRLSGTVSEEDLIIWTKGLI